MAQLLVRNLEDELVLDLKRRAGEHGVSVEEEHRRILREALRKDPFQHRMGFWKLLSGMPDVDEKLYARDPSPSGGRASGEPKFEE
jgi:antitoxin FitA